MGLKKRITEEEFKSFLFKELMKGNQNAHLKTNFYKLLQTKFAIDKTRALKMHDKYYSEWSNLKHQTENEVLIEHTEKSIKNGLKTKNERLLIYQKQINAIESELENGTTKESKIIGGKLKEIVRDLMPIEKSSMRKTLKDLQAEISKIEGDYAPAKSEVTGEIKTSFANPKQEKDFEEFMKKKYNLKEK